MKRTRSIFRRSIYVHLSVVAAMLGALLAYSLFVWLFSGWTSGGPEPPRVPCENRPTAEEAQRILDRHADVVMQIQAVKGVSLYVNLRRCRGASAVRRAELVIEYPGSKQREAVQAIIGDERFFFGVPYSLFNY